MLRPRTYKSAKRIRSFEVLGADPGGDVEREAKTMLAAIVLADPAQADAAQATLLHVCARLAENHGGVDRIALQSELLEAGSALNVSRCYEPDLAKLRQITEGTEDEMQHGIVRDVVAGDRVVPDPDDPAIAYRTRPTTDRISVLNSKIESGSAQLKFDGERGYLRSALDALHIPVESQMAVFSKTSVRAGLIDPHNPRALFD